MAVFEIPFPEWTDAFVEAEAAGREVELFASVIGAEAAVRPEGACVGCWVRSEVVEGRPRFVPRWASWPVLCDACTAGFGAE